MELLQGAVQSVVKTASRRHRRSLDKAVEVLECVAESSKEPLDRWEDDKVDRTVDLIQEAMDEAIKRHRRSIAEAVQHADLEKSASFKEEDGEKDDAGVDVRIQRAVSAAY